MTETRSQERGRSERDIQKDLIKAAKEIENVTINILSTSETSIRQWRALIEEAEKSPVTTSPKSKKLIKEAKKNLDILLHEIAESDAEPETGATAEKEIKTDLEPKDEREEWKTKLEQAIKEMRSIIAKGPEKIGSLTDEELRQWDDLLNQACNLEKSLRDELGSIIGEADYIFTRLKNKDYYAPDTSEKKIQDDLKQAIQELSAILETKSVSELTLEEKKRWGDLLEKAKAKNSKKQLSTEAISLMFTLMNLLDPTKSKEKTKQETKGTTERPKDWRQVLERLKKDYPNLDDIRNGKIVIKKKDIWILRSVLEQLNDYKLEDLPSDQEKQAMQDLVNAFDDYIALKEWAQDSQKTIKEVGQQNSQKSAVVAQKESAPETKVEPPEGTADTTEEATGESKANPDIESDLKIFTEDTLIISNSGTVRKILKKIENANYPGGGFFWVRRYGRDNTTRDDRMTFEQLNNPNTRSTIKDIIPPGEEPSIRAELERIESLESEAREKRRLENINASLSAEGEPETENQESDRNTTLKIHNRIKLKKLLKKTLPESTTTDFLNEEVERQEEFVRVTAIENLFEGNDRQELLESLLFAETGSPEYNRIKNLIIAVLEDAGLLLGIDTDEEKSQIAEELISKQREKISELANIKLSKEAAAKFRWTWFGIKTSTIVGAGCAMAYFGGVPGIAALAATRISISYGGNILRERKKKALIKETQSELRDNPDKFLTGFFSDIAISKQRQLNEVPWMGPNEGNIYENFFTMNPEILAGQSEEEKESLIASLKALDRINEINNGREKSLLEKGMASVKKKIKLPEKIKGFFENNSFIRLGNDISPEAKAVSAAAWSAASIMARTVPGVRNVFLAMAGWKLGGVAGELLNRKLGHKIETNVTAEVALEDRAEDVLKKLEELNTRRSINSSRKWRSAGINVLTKTAGAAVGALIPEAFALVIGSNEAMAATEQSSGVGAPPEIGAESGVSGPTVEASTEKIMKPGIPNYDFEGIPGVSPGMPGEGTYAAPGGGEAGEEILNQKVAEAGMDRSSGGYGQETPRGGSGGGNNAGEAENLTTTPGATPTTRGGIEEMTGKSGNVAGNGAESLAPTIDSLSEKMSEVDGKNARHLWGLIEGKVNAAIGESYGDIKGSEGRMTYIVDAIKDRVAENPEEFGLPKGTNIDVLSKEQLLTLASSDEFDSQLAELLTDEDHGLIKAAESLDESAVRNIESNNEFYRQNVSRLDDSGGLGQADYDLMDKMKSEAGQAAAQQTVTPATGVPEVGTEEITAQAVPEVTSELTDEAARQVAESSGSETYSANEYATAEEAAAAGKTWIPNDGATSSVATETELPITEAEVNDKKTEAWMDLLTKFKANEDNREVVRSLENVFRQSGIEDTYDSEYHSPFFVKGLRRVSDYLSGREILTFQTPYPAEAEDANALGDLRFEYDPTSNYLRVFDGSQWFGERLNNEMTLPKKIEAIFEEIKNSRQ